MEYGLIGGSLSHSFSAEIHRRIAGYDYRLKELRPDELGAFLRNRKFRAVNVTIPYKESVIPFLDGISAEASAIGAVNTIVNRDGKLWGYNTDYSGFRDLSHRAGLNFRGKKVLVLGNGGAAKAVRAVVINGCASRIVHAVRTGKSCGNPVLGNPALGNPVLGDPASGLPVRCTAETAAELLPYEQLADECLDFDVIINTTPVGMYPDCDGTILDTDLFPKVTGVLDCIYNPLRTNLVIDAQKRGITSSGGLYMLVAQAVYAIELFLGRKLPEETAAETFKDILNEKENIVLTGMPSCGKTTVGRIVAEKLGRRFLDTDELICQRTGMPIPDFFENYGEGKFREIESEVISDISSMQGVVIATGGGAVLAPCNVQHLKLNGRITYLDTALENLSPTPGRPLSCEEGRLRELFLKRKKIYEMTADRTVNNNTSADVSACRIIGSPADESSIFHSSIAEE